MDLTSIDLLTYLIDGRFKFIKQNQAVVDDAKLKAMVKYVAATKPAFIDFDGMDHQQIDVGRDRTLDHRGSGNFKGRVYILINHGTFSAASLLATAVKEQRQCVLIGEETGGGRSGNDGGTGVAVNLPYTGFQLILPLWWGASVSTQPDYGEGLKPDVLFAPAKQDIINELNNKVDSFSEIIKATILSSK